VGAAASIDGSWTTSEHQGMIMASNDRFRWFLSPNQMTGCADESLPPIERLGRRIARRD
jgi:hypothetical protein